MSVGLPSDEVAEDYKSSLEDLVDNSRHVINNLTVIAKENIEHASAISRALENHIKTTPPNRKLPALYLLDSIVKNVGTPYTLFLSRNLYSTFMNAYTLVNGSIRAKLDEMLHTWRLPNPGSLETKPVFPVETTRPIELALKQARSAAEEQQQHQAFPAQQEAMVRSRQMVQANVAYRHTPTPPQPNGQYRPPSALPLSAHNFQPGTMANGQYQHSPSQYLQPTQHSVTPSPVVPAPLHHSPKSYQAPPPPVDLPLLHRDIEELIRVAQNDSAINPYDLSVRGRLDALLALRTLLHNQYHSPDQLQQVRTQVSQLMKVPGNLQNASPPAPFYTPTFSHQPSQHQAPPQPPQLQQTPNLGHAPQPSDLQALMSSKNLADIIANVQKSPQKPSISQGSFPHATSSLQPVESSAGGATDLLASLRRAGILNGSAITDSQTPSYATPPLTHLSLSQSAPINNVQLISASLKIPRKHLISFLYEAQPNQCTTCGRRFLATDEGKDKKRKHYDWHFRINQRMNDATKRAQNRSWYVDELEWIKSRDDLEGNLIDSSSAPASKEVTTSTSDPKQKHVLVPSDQTLVNLPCPICQERFTASYNDEVSDWVWMDAIKVGSRIYHASCHGEMKKVASRENTPLRTGTPDSVLGKRKAVSGLA